MCGDGSSDGWEDHELFVSFVSWVAIDEVSGVILISIQFVSSLVQFTHILYTKLLKPMFNSYLEYHGFIRAKNFAEGNMEGRVKKGGVW